MINMYMNILYICCMIWLHGMHVRSIPCASGTIIKNACLLKRQTSHRGYASLTFTVTPHIPREQAWAPGPCRRDSAATTPCYGSVVGVWLAPRPPQTDFPPSAATGALNLVCNCRPVGEGARALMPPFWEFPDQAWPHTFLCSDRGSGTISPGFL